MKTRQEMEELGRKILNASRTELYLDMRFMGSALNSLDYRMNLSTTTVGTDAVSILFNPQYLFQLYMEQPDQLNRTYMHILMHCLFRHMFSAKQHEDADHYACGHCCNVLIAQTVDASHNQKHTCYNV